MTESNKAPRREQDAARAARAAFEALAGPEERREVPARPGSTPVVVPDDSAEPGPASSPRPFSVKLDDSDVLGNPGSITWAAGFGLRPAPRSEADPEQESPRRDVDKGHDPARDAEPVASEATNRTARLKQAGVVAVVIAAAVIATLLVASAVRGPAREEARLEEESRLNGLDSGEEALPEPVPAEDGSPPKTAPPSTAPKSEFVTGGSTGGSASGSSTVKTAPPSTSPADPVVPVVTEGQQIVYAVAGPAMAFTTPSGNCPDYEGNPICTHIGLEVGEVLTLSRVGDAQPETDIWLLDPNGGLALKSGGSGSYVFEAKSPVDKGTIVVYSDGEVVPLFIDYAIAD